MSFRDLLEGARRAVGEAFEPREFGARPMYGVGYVPVSSLDADDAPAPPEGNAWRRAEDAQRDADGMWMLAAGAIVLAAVVDVVVVTRALRRAREEKQRGAV